MGEKLKAMGFRIGVHLVLGLPGSDVEDAINDVHTVSQCGWADHVRIWPALGFQGQADVGSSPLAPMGCPADADVADQMVAIRTPAQYPLYALGFSQDKTSPFVPPQAPSTPTSAARLRADASAAPARAALEGIRPGGTAFVHVNTRDLAWAKGTSNVNGQTWSALFQLNCLEFVADDSVRRGTVRLRPE